MLQNTPTEEETELVMELTPGEGPTQFTEVDARTRSTLKNISEAFHNEPSKLVPPWLDITQPGLYVLRIGSKTENQVHIRVFQQVNYMKVMEGYNFNGKQDRRHGGENPYFKLKLKDSLPRVHGLEEAFASMHLPG